MKLLLKITAVALFAGLITTTPVFAEEGKATKFETVAACLEAKGFKNGSDFRMKPGSDPENGVIQVNGARVDALGRKSDWVSARDDCSATALNS